MMNTEEIIEKLKGLDLSKYPSMKSKHSSMNLIV